MYAFVVDYAPLDQDWLFPVKLLVRFGRLDKFCGVGSPASVSTVWATDLIEIFS